MLGLWISILPMMHARFAYRNSALDRHRSDPVALYQDLAGHIMSGVTWHLKSETPQALHPPYFWEEENNKINSGENGLCQEKGSPGWKCEVRDWYENILDKWISSDNVRKGMKKAVDGCNCNYSAFVCVNTATTTALLPSECDQTDGHELWLRRDNANGQWDKVTPSSFSLNVGEDAEWGEGKGPGSSWVVKTDQSQPLTFDVSTLFGSHSAFKAPVPFQGDDVYWEKAILKELSDEHSKSKARPSDAAYGVIDGNEPLKHYKTILQQTWGSLGANGNTVTFLACLRADDTVVNAMTEECPGDGSLLVRDESNAWTFLDDTGGSSKAEFVKADEQNSQVNVSFFHNGHKTVLLDQLKTLGTTIS